MNKYLQRLFFRYFTVVQEKFLAGFKKLKSIQKLTTNPRYNHAYFQQQFSTSVSKIQEEKVYLLCTEKVTSHSKGGYCPHV